jgi:hypothetical protein
MSCLGWAKEVPRINPQVMPSIKLQQVRNFEKLLQYLETELGWPVEGSEIDDIAFPFDLENDLGLDKKEVAKVRHVYRLKKMHKKQPFGIFFVDFEGKKMPVSVLKRILRTLALKRRANATAADQLAWDVEDLIFISAVGEEKDASREISFAHFRKEPDNRHVLKVLAWDGGDTPLKMDHLDEVLHENLRFPDDVSDVEAWRKSWTAAFRTGIRQNIRRSEELAQALAALAMRINKEALSLIKKESANGPLKTLHAGFKGALINEQTEEEFTDCYAQTITYGLLTAAITKVNQAGVRDLTSTSVLDMVPSTNPFLKDILSSFLEAGGRGQKGIDFDDLGVQDVIDLLRAESTDLPNILRDFGNLTQDEDPVIHFYETFLKIYNGEERKKRGAFYTPRSVVSYIVRSVDEILRKEFGLEDGLADTTTWGEMIARNPAIKLPPLTDNPGEKKTIKASEPFVQILDPATGTATFLVEVINVIEKTVKAKAWTKLKKGAYEHEQHSKREEVLQAWNEYVPEHLLKRLHAYEIMMAPYVIAHMKVGLKLAETGYRFATEERARIYLTNALEPAKDFKERLNFDIPALAIEAKQVNEVKISRRFTVIVGNPPYSGVSSNMSEYAQGLVEAYKFVDGAALNERRIWLQDDYVKFIRKAQMIIDTTDVGVLGYITNHSYIDNPTFRGMRQSLMFTFPSIHVLDLHGNTTRTEYPPEGIVDRNIFDIQQGVAICLAARGGKTIGVSHADLWGTQSVKYAWFDKHFILDTKFEKLTPDSPYYFYKHQNIDNRDEYNEYWKISEAMPVNCAGFITARDHFVIDFDRAKLLQRIGVFADLKKTDDYIRKEYFEGCGSDKYPDGDTRGWKVPKARLRVAGDKKWEERATVCSYRPFDRRYVYWADWMVDWTRPEVSGHMMSGDNIALHVCRQSVSEEWAHVLVARGLIDDCYVSNKSRERGYAHPLYLYDSDNSLALGEQGRPNFAPEFLRVLAEKLNLTQVKPYSLPKDVTAEDILNYAYAVFFSPIYRNRYGEFLKIDFPRLPLTASIKLFRGLAMKGRELAALHLSETTVVSQTAAVFKGSIDTQIEKVIWDNGNIWINNSQTCGFNGVAQATWEFHIGGYQICKKWLEDRRKAGRSLSKEDADSYIKITGAISGTIRVMSEVDGLIQQSGGWPKAFH